LTARNAAYLKSSLHAIEGIAGMQGLKPRMAKLLSQLSAYPDIEDTKLSREDFVLPAFRLKRVSLGISTRASRTTQMLGN
ncbi:hypothetical protein ACV36C_37920, partial [Pseudomonas aeruginosa]